MTLLHGPELVLLGRMIAIALFALVAVTVVHEAILQRAVTAAIQELSRLLAPLEQRHALCVSISCYRFGALPSDLEHLFYESGVRLQSIRTRLVELMRQSRQLRRSRARLLAGAEGFSRELHRVGADLERIARYHAEGFGWHAVPEYPDPWAVLEEANREYQLRVGGHGRARSAGGGC